MVSYFYTTAAKATSTTSRDLTPAAADAVGWMDRGVGASRTAGFDWGTKVQKHRQTETKRYVAIVQYYVIWWEGKTVQ
jgi:hypothetical protein